MGPPPKEWTSRGQTFPSRISRTSTWSRYFHAATPGFKNASGRDRVHRGWRVGPATFWYRVSLSDLTVRVAIIATSALLALVVIGWRQPARPGSHRGSDDNTTDGIEEPVVTLTDSSRRTLARVSALGGIALVASAVIATVVSLVLAWIVTNIIDRL